ncbi:MAG: hypothetical protein AAFZ52_08430, partial [Bacteroidota bacterium]
MRCLLLFTTLFFACHMTQDVPPLHDSAFNDYYLNEARPRVTGKILNLPADLVGDSLVGFAAV